MKKLGKKPTGRSRILIGMLLTAVLIGVGGCGAKDATSEPAASTQQSTASDQENPGQADQQRAANPAINAAMSIRRLQDNEQMVLTSDQKEKIKPILQSLIDTTDPDQTFLQEKADAITAVFTEAQKTYLSTDTPKGNPKGDGQNENGQQKDKTNANPNPQPNEQSGVPNKQAGAAFQPQDLYKQVLDSLNQ